MTKWFVSTMSETKKASPKHWLNGLEFGFGIIGLQPGWAIVVIKTRTHDGTENHGIPLTSTHQHLFLVTPEVYPPVRAIAVW